MLTVFTTILPWLSTAQGANLTFGLCARGAGMGGCPRRLSFVAAGLYFWLALGGAPG